MRRGRDVLLAGRGGSELDIYEDGRMRGLMRGYLKEFEVVVHLLRLPFSRP